jgi:hypothetical protein
MVMMLVMYYRETIIRIQVARSTHTTAAAAIPMHLLPLALLLLLPWLALVRVCKRCSSGGTRRNCCCGMMRVSCVHLVCRWTASWHHNRGMWC